jgi:hypothetical protein
MIKSFKTMLLLGGLLGFLSNPQPLLADLSQGWFNNSATFSINPKWNFKLSQEIRCLDISYADHYLYNWQGGIILKLPKNFYMGFFYKREHTDLEDLDLLADENRYTLEGGWKIGVVKDVDFDVRLKTEIREFDQQSVGDHLRFRLRARFKFNTHIGSLKLKPFIASETFGRTKVYTIQRNRLYLGTYFPVSSKVEIVLNYIWLFTTGKESVHILNSGVDFKF